MLTIKRRVGESAMIGDNVKITVMSVDGAKVRIGIDAPTEVAVHREEIYDKLKQQKLEALHLADANSIK